MNIVNVFKEYKIGVFGRVILFGLFYLNFFCIVVLVMFICNKFDYYFVY